MSLKNELRRTIVPGPKGQKITMDESKASQRGILDTYTRKMPDFGDSMQLPLEAQTTVHSFDASWR